MFWKWFKKRVDSVEQQATTAAPAHPLQPRPPGPSQTKAPNQGFDPYNTGAHRKREGDAWDRVIRK